jgi:hypothetical protein
MANDDYIEIVAGSNYRRTVQIDGVKTTVCFNRFEILCEPSGEVREKAVMQLLKEWLKQRRKAVLQLSGDMSG